MPGHRPTQALCTHPGWHFTEEEDKGHSLEQAEFIFSLMTLLRALFARQRKGWFVGFDNHIALDPNDERVTVAPTSTLLDRVAARG
jgi:hypothetical protein